MDRNFELTIRDIIFFLRKRFLIIVIITMSAGFLSLFVSRFLVQPVYESKAAVVINAENGADTQQMIDTFAIILKNQAFLGKVIENAGVNMDAGSLSESITVTELDATEIFTVEVQASDPDHSKAILNAIIALVPDEISETLDTGSVKVITLSQNTNYLSPNIRNNALIGLFIGFVGSCLTVFVLELLNNKFETSEDVTGKLNYQVIGVIPKFDKAMDHFLIHQTDVSLPESELLPLVESFNAFRTNFKFVTRNQMVQKIMIASSLSGEGKTTIAVNLAFALAKMGNRVLLVDSDFRNPDIGRYLGLSNSQGLSSALSATVAASIIRNKEIELSVLPSGPVPANPNDMLQSNEMSALVRELEREYDTIIFDTPPISSYSDAITLLPLVDGVIFVLEQDHTPFEAASFSKKSLDTMKANVIGCVINKFQAKKTNNIYTYQVKNPFRFGLLRRKK